MACCKLLANREFKLAAPRPAAAAAPDAPRQTERQNTRSGAAQAATPWQPGCRADLQVGARLSRTRRSIDNPD